ncbi:UDP-N-acetylmuramoyl-L-alanine--D-glutamate ligase [Hydrogeniiclostridium mannosilyticum]|uniref:UDP-N-acetylmuramoylalanine--D-glutamate ligase n=1 Tax=Hydrogeniiclostridium mannosilyticum TaxID=2764322 RepID=A0A328UGH9_9FIRM|nr:UDP-N-acetylmuramoyl-L-alanine--D-glutamate ligase [Hydrogeniiclostridium mannosilyticum]RAQ22564.1 UDP-N-acetylmuramoyl-L-alanine--D-glutamate ligase [Hydrogeniiclostridium mannosilyticum]
MNKVENRAERFFQQMQGKRVAFCGIGGSNLPLIKIFAQRGAVVSARDRRGYQQVQQAAELEKMGVRLVLGDGYLQDLTEEVVFRTPGMPYHLPELEAARRRGAAVTSEMEVFMDLCPCKVYGVTGSDGKTTTTTILAKMLAAAGKKVHLGGNIGRPLLPDIWQIGPDDVAVVELSSFQLISMRRSPDVAVVTNISPNHLDVHKDMQEYVEAKENILLHQNAFARTVLNLDNAYTAGFAGDVRGSLYGFSSLQRPERGAFLSAEGLLVMTDGGQEFPVLRAEEIKLPGRHNIENYLAAFCALWGDVAPETMAQVARSFAGVEHRTELVREHRGVRWYNDSIATTPSRTVQGMLSLFPQKILLIAGGYDKKVPFEPMGQPVVEKVKTLVLIGATAPAIEKAVREAPGYREGAPVILHAATLEEAVRLCGKYAQPGDIAALSPACASFDMFPNYETRGDLFKEYVQKLP